MAVGSELGTLDGADVGCAVGRWEGGKDGISLGKDEGIGVGFSEGNAVGDSDGSGVGACEGGELGSGVGFHSHSSGSLAVATAHLPSAHAVQKRDVILPANEHAGHASGESMASSGHSLPIGQGLQPVDAEES